MISAFRAPVALPYVIPCRPKARPRRSGTTSCSSHSAPSSGTRCWRSRDDAGDNMGPMLSPASSRDRQHRVPLDGAEWLEQLVVPDRRGLAFGRHGITYGRATGARKAEIMTGLQIYMLIAPLV